MEKAARGITKEKEKAKESIVGDYKGKGYWGQYSYGKGYQGYCHACTKQGHKANEGLCEVQEVNNSGNQSGADCDAVEIGTVWNFCALEFDGGGPPTKTIVGTQLCFHEVLGKRN